jgi:flagellar M-ring protein FliF
LAASAVDGLLPEAVSVLDTRGNLLNRARKGSSGDDAEPSEATLEYRQKLERDLLAKINSTLEPLLGPDKFRATASVECDFSSAEQSEETYDPTKSVMVSSQKTEDMSGAPGAAGVPGTPSTLPRPTARPAGGGSTVSRRTENINYQSSHTVRHVREPQGAIKRMSVSLLVDSNVRYEGSGAKAKRIVEAPSADKLKAIHDLVAGVIGLSTERGDQLVVETLPFESTLNPEQLPPPPKPAPPPPSWQDQFLKNRVFMIGAGAGAALLLAVLLVVLRVLRKKARRAELPGELPAGSTPDQLQAQIENRLAEQAEQRQKQEAEALNALKLPPVTKKSAVLTKHISEQAKKDAAGMAHVLRAWMAEPGDEVKH